MDRIRITALEIANVKRVRAVALAPAPAGLTVIGGKNAQGKTSVLDAIAYALGGERRRPTALRNDEALSDPYLRVELSSGLIVERKGKNSALVVTDATGARQGQRLLDAFVSEFALDLPRFLALPEEAKAMEILRHAGLDLKLEELAAKEKELYDKRRTAGQIATQKAAAAAELPEYPDAPVEETSASALLEEVAALNRRNEQRGAARLAIQSAEAEAARLATAAQRATADREAAEKVLSAALEAEKEAERAALAAKEAAAAMPRPEEDEDAADLMAKLDTLEAENAKVRANRAKEMAQSEAQDFAERRNALDGELADVREERRKLLAGVELPLSELAIVTGDRDRPALAYNGKRWDSMATSEQLKVATAIAAADSTTCGFVLLDKLEALDPDELAAFGDWLELRGLQAICTRVSTGQECTIIIEDGMVRGEDGAA